jgi:hypothetical protein
MHKFTLFWLDGKREVVTGETIADAARRAGIQRGALQVIDFYENGEDDSWEWNSERRSWVQKNSEQYRIFVEGPAVPRF